MLACTAAAAHLTVRMLEAWLTEMFVVGAANQIKHGVQFEHFTMQCQFNFMLGHIMLEWQACLLIGLVVDLVPL